MDELIQEYFENDAKKLHRTVNNILRKIGGLSDKDKDDFYSAASLAIAESWKKNDYDESKGLKEGYLYRVINFAVLSEVRDRNRFRRSNTRPKKDKEGNIIHDKNGKVEYEFIPDISIDTPISYDGNDTVESTLSDRFDIEREIIEEKREIYSDKMMKYLNRLSELQREVLRLMIAGYIASEIITELHITQKQYSDCNAAIHSYRNISVLF